MIKKKVQLSTPVKKKIRVLLGKNSSLRFKKHAKGYTPEKMMVRTYKRVHFSLVYSKTRTVENKMEIHRTRLPRRLSKKIRRYHHIRLAKKIKVDPFSSYGRMLVDFKRQSYNFKSEALLAHDNLFKVVPIKSLFNTTLGAGQHTRKLVSSTLVKDFGFVNNARFFYDFSENLPGTHPFTRIMGMFTKKGKKMMSFSFLNKSLARFKADLRKVISHPLFIGRGLYRASLGRTMSVVLYGMQGAIQNVRPYFRSIAYKVAASRKKRPALNGVNKSYSLLFSSIKSRIFTGNLPVNKKKLDLYPPFTSSFKFPYLLAPLFSEALWRKGLLRKQQYLASIDDAVTNIVNVGSGKRRRRRNSF